MTARIVLGVWAMVAATGVGVAHGAEYVLDPGHTQPHFSVRHLGYSTTIGRFNKTEGTLTMDREAGTGSLEVVIDATSLDTGNRRRDNHVLGKDFLHTEEYPTITYRADDVTYHGEAKDRATVRGELTLLGVTLPVTLNVTQIRCGQHPFNGKPFCGFDAEATIKRSDFGMTYGLPTAVGDEIQIMLSSEAFEQSS
ncbi:MAG: YceI family protein [Candidatus Competibacterales bacterium]